MKTRSILLTFLLIPIFGGFAAARQGPQQASPGYSSSRPQADGASILETGLLSLLQRKEQVINSTERRHQDLRTLQSAKFKSQGIAGERIESINSIKNSRSRTP